MKNKVYICCDCEKEIKSPYAKPFSNGDGKTRCAGCAVDFYMKNPNTSIRCNGELIFTSDKE